MRYSIIKRRVILITLTVILVLSPVFVLAKHADLAGSWYPSDPTALRKELEGYLKNASMEPIKGDVIGVIAPHAGIRFSGPVAAYSFKALMGKNPRKVVIVGFTHRRYYPGKISVFDDKSYITPLGEARVNERLTKKFLAFSDRFKFIPEAFFSENSVELEIPFAQVALKDPEVVLIAICDQGRDNSDALADALYDVLKDEKDFAMIASADMSHQLPYDVAKKQDATTIAAIKSFDPGLFYRKSIKDRNDQRMCGLGAVYAVMKASKRLGANEVKVFKYANSGDTSGMKSGVVGYMSAAFIKGKGSEAGSKKTENKTEESDMFDQAQRDKLLKIARDTIKHYLATGKRLEPEVDDETLKEEMGVFVTLHEDGRLRGCIGHMEATGPLDLTVRDMAIASATEDPRFPPLTSNELDKVDIEISVLSPMRKIADYNEIEVGKHGVMVRRGLSGGVYLPQVAVETGWDREQFMNSLCANKAGLPMNAWKTGACDIYVFTAEVFGEKEKAD